MFPLTVVIVQEHFMTINSLAPSTFSYILKFFFLIFSGLWYHGHCCQFIWSM